MRPTYLQFRNPKEQTGEFLNISMTVDGKGLKYANKTPLKSTFPRGERWQHIKEVACRTSTKVGPGCYKFPFTTNKGRSARIEKDTMTAAKAWEYLYVGDCLIKKERPSSRFSVTPGSTNAFNNSRGFSPRRSHNASAGVLHADLTRLKERPQSAIGRGGIGNYGYSREEDLRRGSPARRGQNSYNDLTISQSELMRKQDRGSHKPRERDFYERLNDNWEEDHKIVITNDKRSKPARSSSVGRGFDQREERFEW